MSACHYSHYYHHFSNWISFKIYLIWAHLKFHYKLHFRSTSATISESKFSSSTFSSYPIPLWQCMMRKKTYMLFLVCQSFLPPLNFTKSVSLNYTNSNSLLSVLIAQLRESNLKWSVIQMNKISEILLNAISRKYVSCHTAFKQINSSLSSNNGNQRFYS